MNNDDFNVDVDDDGDDDDVGDDDIDVGDDGDDPHKNRYCWYLNTFFLRKKKVE